MDFDNYKMMAELMQKVPPQKETPKGQKFHIGEVVKITNPKSWFAEKYVKQDKERLYQIEYSYTQKYNSSDDRHLKTYSLKHLFEANTTAWYNESELELVKGIEEINEESDILEYERLKIKFGAIKN